jgi:hypothetical protein
MYCPGTGRVKLKWYKRLWRALTLQSGITGGTHLGSPGNEETHMHNYTWTNCDASGTLTASNLNDALDRITYESIEARPGTLFAGTNYPLYIYDEAEEEITPPEPPCEDLGEHLLRKYNGLAFSIKNDN